MSADQSARRAGPRAVDTGGQLPLTILSEEFFQGALARERRRADRCEMGFIVLTIAVTPSSIETVVAALATATRDTDLIGWTEQNRVLGVILPEITAPDDAASRIELRVRHEFARRFGAEAAEQLAVSIYVHERPRLERGEGLASSDPLLQQLVTVDARQRVYLAAKRVLDLMGSAILLLASAPLFALVALLVKCTSPGPVLFRQPRVGHRARVFTMLKFRTMRTGSDPRVHQEFVKKFIQSGEHDVPTRAGSPALFKITRDSRTTPVGRFLRRTSLDELPQFWNVLMGDMSLVGPRPPIAYELENYRPWHLRRVLEAKPGVTGIWQVAGRSRTTFDEMVRMDLRYARTRSLKLDVAILLATPRAVLTGRGAA